ncbi:MAG: hypothetical protein ACLPT4_16540 [Verrucomicrobiia bacterium]
MYVIRGFTVPGYAGFNWKELPPRTWEAECVKLVIAVAGYHRQGMPAPRATTQFLEAHPEPWIQPGAKAWVFKLAQMKTTFSILRSVPWLHSDVSVQPEQESPDEVCFYIWPDQSGKSAQAHVPGETFIKAGDKKRGLELVKNIFRQVKREVCIQDGYIKPTLFQILEETCPHVSVRILTRKAAARDAATLKAYCSYKKARPQCEMRTFDPKPQHPRWILFDAANVYRIDHSISGIGDSDAQLSVDDNPSEKWARFEEHWNGATPVDETGVECAESAS